MAKLMSAWFDEVDMGHGRIRRISKFARKDFDVGTDTIQQRWPSWTADEKVEFAGAFAFSRRANLNGNDRRLLNFLIENGEPRIWRMLALPVVWNLEYTSALTFLLARIREYESPLANYYQALGKLGGNESIPTLEEALLKHRRQIDSLPRSQQHGERFLFLDFLACSAALLVLTGEEKYEINIRQLAKNSTEKVRQLAEVVLAASRV